MIDLLIALFIFLLLALPVGIVIWAFIHKDDENDKFKEKERIERASHVLERSYSADVFEEIEFEEICKK